MKKPIFTIGPNNFNSENFAKLIDSTRHVDGSKIVGLPSTETVVPLSEKTAENSPKNVIDETMLATDANGIIQVPTLSESSQRIIDETLQVKDACGNLRLAQFEDWFLNLLKSRFHRDSALYILYLLI